MASNFATFHSHPRSFDSASTPEQMARKELELGTGYITVTDHGTLEGCRQIYDLTKEKEFKGLKPILGLEAYFRADDDPDILAAGFRPDKDGTLKDYFKYAHLTLHCMDEAAYFALTKQVSQAPLEKHGSEVKPIFNWKDLEILGGYNITAGSSCLIGMVSRHLLSQNNPRLAMRYYEKLRSLFKPGDFYAELFPHVCDRNWDEAVFVHYEDGTEDRFKVKKKFKTSAGETYADVLARAFKKDPVAARKNHVSFKEVMNNRKWEPGNQKPILDVEYREGFIFNECSGWHPDGDVQAGANRFVLRMAQKYGDPVVVSDDSHFANPEDKIIQDIRLGQSGGWKFGSSYHRRTGDMALATFQSQLGISEAQFESWVENNKAWASRFNDFSFSPRRALPTKFYPEDTFGYLKTLIKKHGRMDWSNPEWRRRLQQEIQLLHKNGTIDLLPYFFVLEEIIGQYIQKGEIIGPGRGSAAGVLLSYLLDITQIDPIRHKLSLDRFLTLDRIASNKLPDIDTDFPHWDLLIDPKDSRKGWLQDRFGDCYARLSTDVCLHLKQSIRDVFRIRNGRERDPEIEQLCRELPDPPQGVKDKDFVFGYEDNGNHIPGIIETCPALQVFVKKYPTEWENVQKLIGLQRFKSLHACGYIIADEPIQNFIPTIDMDGVRATQYNASSVEAAGGLKVDLLRVNSIRDIGITLKMIQARMRPDIDWTPTDPQGNVQFLESGNRRIPKYRAIPFRDQFYDIWDLPADMGVYRDICEGRVETVFQLDAPAARQGLKNFRTLPDGTPPIKSIADLAAFTALDRPGPLDAYVTAPDGSRHDMLVEFANRAKGLPAVGALPVLDKELPETYGILVFQEGLQHIFQKIGSTSAIDANNFRADIGKKKMAKVIKWGEKFRAGAIPQIGEAQANQLWSQMQTFGQYGFCASVLGDVILPYVGGQKALKDFRGGEKVFCVNQRGELLTTEVVALHDHGILNGFELTFDDDSTITVSANHKFLTLEGQVPLYGIIERNLAVLSRPSFPQQASAVVPQEEVSGLLADSGQNRCSGTGMDVEVRREISKSDYDEVSSKSLSVVLRHQEEQYTDPTAHAQSEAGTEAGFIFGGAKDIRPERNSVTEGSQFAQMANSASRRGESHLGISEESGKAIQNGDLAEVKWGFTVGGCPHQVWKYTKTSGFCQSRRQDLGGSGRILPLFRNEKFGPSAVATSGQASYYSDQRCDAESRSDQPSRCDIDPASRRLFQNLYRRTPAALGPLAYSDAPLSSTRGLVLRRIVRVRPVGECHMYDLEVAHSKHNYLMANGVVTSNSHAVSYAINAYTCAWLKHHYPLEWWTAVLQNADRNEVNEDFWPHCGKFIALPDLATSGSNFEIRGDKIQAPLWLLKGIGDAAHQQLMEIRPFGNIEEMLQKIEAWKTAHPRKLMKKNKETGEMAEAPAPGVTALKKTIIQNLIVTGVANNLFPERDEYGEPATAVDRLTWYCEAMKKVTGKKVESLSSQYSLESAIVNYQLKKQVLPAYNEDLLALCRSARPRLFVRSGGRLAILHLDARRGSETGFPVISGEEWEILRTLPTPALEEDRSAVLAYVISQVNKSYVHKESGETRQRTELVLDASGYRTTVVRFGGANGLPEALKQPLTGAVVSCLLLRREGQSDQFLLDVIVIAPPLQKKEKENADTEASP